ncbi:phage repressor protein CI [Kosakonia sacchari]|uniref:phage repressor protein CI n=1 Tax=Kosakonia sacchari TaxID=1158459 RepID=UPI00136428C7|nr:phage repressor protein CI [Kosakonia sacchari]QHM95640.1 phage repressor protein [Kosakonia sacchari]
MSTTKSPNEITLNFESGGREAIERIISSYGFTTRQALADHLKISKSTLANRYLRDTFPSDWIIQCSLETGASLSWLATGNGRQFDDKESDILKIPQIKLDENKILNSGYLYFDRSLICTEPGASIAIDDMKNVWIARYENETLDDGLWLVEYQQNYKIKEIFILPGGLIRLTDEKITFECNRNDIKIIAKIIGRYNNL